MTIDQHLWSCALALERQHGEAALLIAAKRAYELAEQGDYEDARTWLEIVRRLEALEDEEGGALQ